MQIAAKDRIAKPSSSRKWLLIFILATVSGFTALTLSIGEIMLKGLADYSRQRAEQLEQLPHSNQ